MLDKKKVLLEILGDDILLKLINDQNEVIYQLDDPWRETEFTGIYNKKSASFAAEIISKITDVFEKEIRSLFQKRLELLDMLTDNERNDYVHKNVLPQGLITPQFESIQEIFDEPEKT